MVNGTDLFADFKESIGVKSETTITLNGCTGCSCSCAEKGAPIHKDWLPVDGKCEWRYEIDGLWSSSGIERTDVIPSCYHPDGNRWCFPDRLHRFHHFRIEASQ